MNRNVISISMENTKMGPIPSFSLPPVITCASNCECAKCGCYAKKMFKFRKTIANSWSKNLSIARDAKLFKSQINGWLAILQPKAFRIHVGGDFFCEEYLNAWCDIARANKDTKFFAFTKQFDVVRKCRKNIPKNLSIILSAWITKCFDGWSPIAPPEDLMMTLPVAWVVKPEKMNHPSLYYPKRRYQKCSGHCVECGKCFNLKRKDSDILFDYH